jgi:invasion protein IalB
MKAIAKYFLGAAAVGVGAIAAIAILPGLVAETSGKSQSETSFIAPAQAETIKGAQTQIAQASPSGSLPGGATSVRETHQDWLVSCGKQEEATRCVMSQQQYNAQSRQRVLAIELQRSGDQLSGALVLPFGLSLDSGVTLQVDENSALPSARFRTCLPAGCVAPLTFNAETVQALSRGTSLKISAVAEGGKPVAMSVSLKGFSAARDRLLALTK